MEITKRGRPVARLMSPRQVRRSILGRDGDIIKNHGDIGVLIDLPWEADPDCASRI